MKTSMLSLFALAFSVVLAIPVQGGGYAHGGGGGNFAIAGPGPARAGGGSSFHSMPTRSFGARTTYSAQRFSPGAMYSPSATLGQRYINSLGGASVGTRQFTPRNINRGDRLTRLSNAENRVVTNPRRERTGPSQVRNGNALPANWRSHVVAQHSANWHRDWDRGRDHWCHGHHCRFINGSWVVFDLGFYPWWLYGYPYDYYAYDYYGYPYGYYPYGYQQSDYESRVYQGEPYYDQDAYNSPDQYTHSSVAAAQERLAQQGYYRGAIDGIIGPETRPSIARYQRDHGLRVTGYLTADTLQALGLPQLASN